MSNRRLRLKLPWIGVALLLASMPTSQAYPPAPHHTIYGLVRDESGNPLRSATIILESASGVKIVGQVASAIDAGVNYQLTVPMDAGITDDSYQPTALQPTAPFKIKVQIGQTTFLPIQMTANYAQLGQPGKKTRIDLSLGQDANGDGIPDAWEKALLAGAGLGTDLTDIHATDHIAGNAMTLMQLYIAGIYTIDPKDGFSLKIVRDTATASVLEFMAVRGRSYTVYGSSDLENWTPVSVSSPPDDSTATLQPFYYASATQVVQAAVKKPENGPILTFFKLFVQ